MDSNLSIRMAEMPALTEKNVGKLIIRSATEYI